MSFILKNAQEYRNSQYRKHRMVRKRTTGNLSLSQKSSSPKKRITTPLIESKSQKPRGRRRKNSREFSRGKISRTFDKLKNSKSIKNYQKEKREKHNNLAKYIFSTNNLSNSGGKASGKPGSFNPKTLKLAKIGKKNGAMMLRKSKEKNKALALIKETSVSLKNKSHIRSMIISSQVKRKRLIKNIDKELDKRRALVPAKNGYNDGPALRDERRNQAAKYKKEAVAEWNDFFDEIKVTRWDNFEDFLYLLCEKYLVNYFDLVKYSHWDKVFSYIYGKLAKNCKNNDKIAEVPQIPFSNTNQIYTGKIVRKENFIDYVASVGIENSLKHAATIHVNKKERQQVKLFRRIYTKRQIHTYSCGTIFEGCFKEGKKDGYGRLKLSSGDVYEGEFFQNFRHGSGIMKNYTEEEECIVYEGDWENDFRDGYGVYMCNDNSNFSGQWKEGKQFYGIFNGATGHRYMGFWDGRKMDKRGVYYDPYGKMYKGEFDKGTYKGIGELKKGELKIAGHFEKDKVNRQGLIKHQDYTYNGDLIRDKPHGWGVKNFKNGDEYKGYFKNGYECGEGIMKLQNGDNYDGNFDHGKFNGKGILRMANGSIYEGDFKNGYMEGYGKLVYSIEGDFQKVDYEGEFKKNHPHGKGVLKFENGSVYHGEMKFGKMSGEGKMDIKKVKGEDEGMEVYKGEFFDDLFEGYGSLIKEGKVYYKGYWRYGKKHGQAEYLDMDGKMQQGLFCNDKLLRREREMY